MAKNITDFRPEEIKNLLKNLSPKDAELLSDTLAKKSRNKTPKKEGPDPIVKATKATKESVKQLSSIVTELNSKMSAVGKTVSATFGTGTLYNKLIEKAMTLQKIPGQNAADVKTKNLLAAKLISLSTESLSESTANSFTEFKRLNPEFESITTLAEKFADQFRAAGYNITKDNTLVLEMAKGMQDAAEAAMMIDKATGETKLQGIQASLEKIKKKNEEWNSLLEPILNVYNKIKNIITSNTVATVTFFTILTSKIISAGKAALEMRKELGLSVIQTTEMSLKMTETVWKTKAIGGNAKEAAEALTALANYSGDLSMATGNAAANVVKMTKLTGISADTAAKLNVVFKHTGGDSQKIADSLTNTAINIARMNNIAPQKFMNELANNTERFAGMSKKGVENIMAATVQATKLNVEYTKLLEVGNKFLDVQGLIEDTMTTNALLGTNINLTKAAAKYNANDMRGFIDSLTSELKNIDLSKLSMIEKQQISQLFGLTTEELQNVIKNADKIKGINGEITMDMIKNASKLEGTKEKFWDALVGWATPQNVTMVLAGGKMLFGALSISFGAITGLIGKTGTKLRDVASKLSFKSTGGTSAGLSKMFDGLGKINTTSLLKGAGAIAIMAGSLFIFGKALQEFKGIGIKEMAVAAGGMLTLAGGLYAIGTIITSPQGALALIGGAAAMAILSGALWIFGKALQEVAKSIPIFADGFSKLTPAIKELSVMVWALPLIGAGFASIGAGLIPLAIGLAMITPLVPILSTLSNLSSTIFNKNEKEETKTTSSERTELQIIADDISRIKDFMLNGGANIYIDGRKVGSWMGKLQSNIIALENRGSK